MGKQTKTTWEDQLYDESDYDLAQARLDRIESALNSEAASDHLLYKSLEGIFLSVEPEEIKEGMVVCLLEKFFFRIKNGLRN